jgi:AraC family transcriptional regulator
MSSSSTLVSGAAASRFEASGEAIVRAVGFAPELDSRAAGWNSLALYAWRGYCAEARFEPFPEPVIVYHVGGAESVRVRVGRNWGRRTHPGLITVIPPATPVSWDIRGEVHSRTLHLGSRFFSATADWGPRAGPEGLSFRCGVEDPLVIAAIQTLESEIVEPAQCGSLYADAVADTLALHLLRNGVSLRGRPGKSLPSPGLRRSLELLEARIESGVSLQELAEAAGLSRAFFANAFRRSTGMPPHRYLTQRRLARACELLHCTTMSITDIALRCGFSSHAHFSDCFRRHYQLTPKRYRQLFR